MTKKHLFQNGLALFVCLFLFAGALFAQEYTNIELVKNSGTWVVPTTLNGNNIVVTSVKFEGVGGGGGGGFAKGDDADGDDYLYQVAGAGGGGAYAATNVITDMTPGEPFAITVGAGGYNHASLVTVGEYNDDLNCGCVTLLGVTTCWQHCNYKGFMVPWPSTDWSDGWIPMPTSVTWYAYPFYKNRVEGHGGTTEVKRNGTPLLSAGGGRTCLGVNNPIGAAGGIATVGAFLGNGGKGGDATDRCSNLLGNMSTGGGGGAGNPAGINNNGEDAHCAANSGWGHGGQGYDSGDGYPICGAGARGTSDFNNVIGGPGSGYAGDNYGGGGGGAKSGSLNWHRGGPGAPGVVKVTYTYTIVPNESIDITTDASGVAGTANVCSGTNFDVALNITTNGFNLSDATVELGTATTPAGVTLTGVNKNFTDGKWHVTGTAANTTSGTLTATIPVTVKTPSGNAQATANVTIHAYGKLDGGLIQKNQYLCYQQEVSQLVNVASATGGKNSANPTYQWSYSNTYNGTYTDIDGATKEYYTPTQTGGHLYYKRAVVDECGTAYAHDNDYRLDNYVEILNPNPMNPGMIEEESPTICGNEPFNETIYSHFSGAIPEGSYGINIYWQRKVNDGDWEYISGAVSTGYVVGLTPGDGLMVPGNVIQYRYMVSLMEGYATCERIPSNNVYTVRVGGLTDYTGQFPDVNITLWYGACDTSIANLPAPTLDPTPVSITRVDNLDRVGVEPGEYTITWSVVADDCGGTVEYNQTVKVEYPACGTLEQPMTAFDEDGNEYQTIRIGCDCWFAENLKSYSENSSYYEEDAANEAFGKLYPWSDAVGSNNEERATMLGTTYIQGICPDGWAIPTVAQYMTMMNVAGSAEDVKSDDENAWLPGEIGTNTSGFAAMGAGFFEGMQYQRLRGYTDFWTADLNASNSTVAKATELRIGCDDLVIVDKNKANKLSVRCVRVEPVEPEEFTCGVSTVKDANGNTYSTVLIGEQCWTKSNLRAKKYADGSFISNTTYFIDPSYTNPAYGYLYTWDAVSNTAGLCPTGWHVSTKEDWQTLGNNISSNKDIAAKSGWLVSTNENMIGYEQESSNNSTGFSAFPAGQFNTNSYQSANRLATFWTNTEYNENNAWFVSLNALMSTTWPTAAGMKTWGRSVRCVKNAE